MVKQTVALAAAATIPSRIMLVNAAECQKPPNNTDFSFSPSQQSGVEGDVHAPPSCHQIKLAQTHHSPRT